MATKKASPPLVQLTAWSYSRYADYDQCPFKCKCKHIDRLREPDNEHTDRGTLWHKLGEQFVLGQLKLFPKEFHKNFKERFMHLRKVKALVEQEWAFDNQFNVVKWFAKDAWLRIKMDAHHIVGAISKKTGSILNTIDYKTGKQHPEHAQQRSLYALGGFYMYPDVSNVHVEHWYLDSGEVGQDDFKRTQLKSLETQWEQRTRAMLSDKRFAPRPGSYCRWCHFRKDNGGPCQF